MNQALLKQVLLAFARWNKSVGYCQGFNILAAVILEVVEWKVEEALMVMIFLIEGLLPESYFANNLRGLSVDMAVFRDLMKIHLNDLSNHLDHLQYSSLEGVACYEPPLVNVFTLQWFLTLFSNCLPKGLVLRIWDLIFLEGSEVLLRTALIIWCNLSQQIYSVKSADEFYSIMGLLMMQLMEYTTTDGNKLITDIINLAEFPYVKVAELREKYTYHIRPLANTCNSPSGSSSFSGSSSPFSFVRKGLHLLPFTSSSDEDDMNSGDHFEFFFNQEQLISMPRPGSPCVTGSIDADQRGVTPTANSKNRSSTSTSASGTSSPDRMSLDVSLLRKQYVKLCQRQKQAHLILTEGLRYGYSSTFNRSNSGAQEDSSKKLSAKQETNKKSHDKSTINSLLSGKPALTVKSSNKQPLVALPTSVNKTKSKDTRITPSQASAKTDATTRSHIDESNSSAQAEGEKVRDKASPHLRSASISSGVDDNGHREGKCSANHQRDKSGQVVKTKIDSRASNDQSESARLKSSGHERRGRRETNEQTRANTTESSNDSEDETGAVSDEASPKESESTCKETSQSSSTSINESSSSSSKESYASSGSTVDTVVMKKRKKSEDAALNSSQGRKGKDVDDEAEAKADKTGKPGIVVVRRRFGPNVRRASSILEQTSFSIDEPVDGDDESTSSSETDHKTSGAKDNSPSQATSSRGVSSKRKDFQRRHQNTVTLTWSEIRKIRKTSAPAAVIRSSLSSPPSDLSPPDDGGDEPIGAGVDDSSNDSLKNDHRQQLEGKNECQETMIDREDIGETSPVGDIARNKSPPNKKQEERVEYIESPASSLAKTAASPGHDVLDESAQEVAKDEKLRSSAQDIDQSFPGGQKQPATDEMSSKQLSILLPSQARASEEKSDKTTGPDDQETDCDNESDWESDPVPAVAQAKRILHTLQVTHDTDAGAEDTARDVTGGDDGHAQDREDGEERIIKSVQSEISNLTIEECLARLSARISTLNSELQ